MTLLRLARVRALAAPALVAAAVAMSGCFNPFSPQIAPVLGIAKPAPVPNSASGVLRLFEWCYNNKAIAEYRELFTDDYQFLFSPVDSTGFEYKGTPWRREDEIISTTHLFVGGSADQPPANTVRLSLTPKNFFVYPDPNYVKWDPTGIWHKNIRAQIVLNIKTDDGNAIDVSGAANFYLVRGDSALIPEELKALGFGPDPKRWYIRRQDDETAQEGGGLALRLATDAARRAAVAGRDRPTPSAASSEPPLVASWGYIKVFYLNLGRAAPLRAPPGTTTP